MTVVLERVTAELAQALVAGDLSGVAPGEGWPHADTLDGIGVALRHGAPLWLVLVDGVVVGDCGTLGPPDEDGRTEIGYGLAAPYQGRGHGSALVRALARELFADPAVRSLSAKVLVENIPSRRALERAGFVLEHVDAEYALYALAQ